MTESSPSAEAVEVVAMLAARLRDDLLHAAPEGRLVGAHAPMPSAKARADLTAALAAGAIAVELRLGAENFWDELFVQRCVDGGVPDLHRRTGVPRRGLAGESAGQARGTALPFAHARPPARAGPSRALPRPLPPARAHGGHRPHCRPRRRRGALAGAHGPRAAEAARWLVGDGLAHACASRHPHPPTTRAPPARESPGCARRHGDAAVTASARRKSATDLARRPARLKTMSEATGETEMATLLEKIKTHEAKVAVIGIGYVGLPLVRRDGAGRLPHHRLRQARVQGEAGQRRQDRTSATSPTRARAAGLVGQARRHDRSQGARRGRRRRHLRADAAEQDQGAGQRLHHDGGRVAQAAPAQGHAHRPRVDDLPRLHAGDPPAEAAGVGAQGRRGLLPLLLARARRSGQREVSDQEHAEGRRRHHAALPRGDPGHVQPRHRHAGAGVVDGRGRDGASCSRTPSARSTSASSTKWPSCATSSA